MKKPVLIIENSGNGLKINENAQSKKEYLLDGVFTEFDVKNRNERIYTADEFVPHVDRMMEKKEWGVVYGEFDHPDVFDVSMKYVSHTIESATYNQEKNRLDGTIRLLNTHWGKEAKAIVDDGCPLFVSSRAAGVTEGNGYVKLKQLFTYDIVADPGFASAKVNLQTMNESLGFSDKSNFGILEANKSDLALMVDKYERSTSHVFDLSSEEETNKLFEMNKNNDNITKGQMTDYSKYLTSQIKEVESRLLSKVTESKGGDEIKKDVEQLAGYYDALQEQNDKVIKYLDYLSEKISHSISINEKLEKKTDDLANYSNYLAENLDKNIDYSNYLAENLDKSIDYGDYLAENLDKNIDYSNYLAENLDRNIEYSEYIAENLDQSINYSNYLAENLDKNIDYSNYLAENLDKNIDYADYLAENLDATIGYTEYLTENLDATIGYTEYIVETLDKSIDYSDYISECVDKVMDYSNMITEKLNNSTEEGMISEKIDSASEYLKAVNESYDEETEVEAEEEEEGTVCEHCEGVGCDHCNAVEEAEESAVENNETVEEEEETTENSELKENFKEFIKDESNKEDLSSKIDTLIEEAKKREASKDQKPAFFAFLTPDDTAAFENLSQDEQDSVKVAFNESVGFYSRHDVMKIMTNVLESEEASPEQVALDGMPEDIKAVWESMDNKSKKSILSQTRFYDLSSENLVEHFWSTRKFSKPLNEGKTLVDFENPMENMDKISDSDIDGLMERFNGIR